jgi:Cytidylate kinase-like family
MIKIIALEREYGASASVILHDRTDTRSVFLFAPRTYRFRRVLARLHDETEANSRLDTTDRGRAAFVKHYFGGEWPGRALFHLMLNTAVGFDLVVDTICQFKAGLDQTETESAST